MHIHMVNVSVTLSEYTYIQKKSSDSQITYIHSKCLSLLNYVDSVVVYALPPVFSSLDPAWSLTSLDTNNTGLDSYVAAACIIVQANEMFWSSMIIHDLFLRIE